MAAASSIGLPKRTWYHRNPPFGLSPACSPRTESYNRSLRYPDNPELRVSHETINRSLLVQARGVLKAAGAYGPLGLRCATARRRAGRGSVQLGRRRPSCRTSDLLDRSRSDDFIVSYFSTTWQGYPHSK
jgi:hypothetical protein